MHTYTGRQCSNSTKAIKEVAISDFAENDCVDDDEMGGNTVGNVYGSLDSGSESVPVRSQEEGNTPYGRYSS